MSARLHRSVHQRVAPGDPVNEAVGTSMPQARCWAIERAQSVFQLYMVDYA